MSRTRHSRSAGKTWTAKLRDWRGEMLDGIARRRARALKGDARAGDDGMVGGRVRVGDTMDNEGNQRRDKIAACGARMRTILAQERAEREAVLATMDPAKAPRYDEVWAEGVAWLDEMA